MGHEARITSIRDKVESLVEGVEEDESVLADAFDGGLACKNKNKVVRVVTPATPKKGDRWGGARRVLDNCILEVAREGRRIAVERLGEWEIIAAVLASDDPGGRAGGAGCLGFWWGGRGRNGSGWVGTWDVTVSEGREVSLYHRGLIRLRGEEESQGRSTGCDHVARRGMVIQLCPCKWLDDRGRGGGRSCGLGVGRGFGGAGGIADFTNICHRFEAILLARWVRSGHKAGDRLAAGFGPEVGEGGLRVL